MCPYVVNFGMHVLHTDTSPEAGAVDMHILIFAGLKLIFYHNTGYNDITRPIPTTSKQFQQFNSPHNMGYLVSNFAILLQGQI